MSVFRLESVEYGIIDSRYIQSIDLTVTNLSGEDFDILVHAYNPHGVCHISLFNLRPGSVVPIQDIPTNFVPFSLLLVTNINNYHTLGITVTAKSHGAVVALFTQEEFMRLD